MVIGIIGASISGLVAGKRLADAGHHVTVIEKQQEAGGRLATVELDDLFLDYGVSHFEADTQTFQAFVDELEEKELAKEWAEEFAFFDGTELHDINPNTEPQIKYVGTRGNQSIAHSLTRWVDIKSEEKAGGLTYIGPDRSKKRSWMINLTDITVFECDAVIVATPAVEAYGIIQTIQNRTATRKIIREIDEIRYDGAISLACTFDHEVPEWDGINVEESNIKWMGNESSKNEGAEKAGLVIRSTDEFYRRHEQTDDERVKDLLLKEAAGIMGSWIEEPKSTFLHRWRYFEARNPLNEYFMEMETEETPLALVGDYLGGSSVENAYVSGYNLAEYWIKKYSEVPA